MDPVQKFTIIIFKLPDGNLVLQRRSDDAPYGAGLLGIFGGWVEENETPEQCLVRELREETSLNTDKLPVTFLVDFIIPAGEDYVDDRHFYLFEAPLENLDFKVYEGKHAESHSLEDIKQRTDLTGSADFVFKYIYPLRITQ